VIATKDLEIGEPLPELRSIASNHGGGPGRSGESNIHNDAAAQRMGFERGFVSTGQTLAWISRVLVRFFGPAYFESGELDVAYVLPLYDEESISVGGVVKERVPEDGGVRLICDVWLARGDGTKVIAGTASAVVKE
jgi:hypothetical protein